MARIGTIYKSNFCRFSILVALIAAVFFPITHRGHAQTRTFLVEDVRYFEHPGGCCPACNDVFNSDLDDLADELWAAGWAGWFFTGTNSWPTDFQDPSVFSLGEDHLYADAHMLSVVCTHGNIDKLTWGDSHDGVCKIKPSTEMRIGTMSGNMGGYMILYACCVMYWPTIGTLWPNPVWQMFGFHNYAKQGTGMIDVFFDDTSWAPNWYSWLENVKDRPGWLTGDNSPVVVSSGRTGAEAWTIRNGAALKAGAGLNPTPDNLPYYVRDWYDNGLGYDC